MAVRRMSSAAVLLVLWAACVHALELRLEALKPSYRPGESVVVRVLVSNPLGSEQVRFLKRAFWLVPYSYPMDGDLGLTVQVTGPDGMGLRVTTERTIVARQLTEPVHFQPRYPGCFFGEDIALDGEGFRYAMTSPGVYRVKAMLSTAAPRKWFDEWRRSHRKSVAGFERESLFEGLLFSNAIDVFVAE
jgi:hypothetical protein